MDPRSNRSRLCRLVGPLAVVLPLFLGACGSGGSGSAETASGSSDRADAGADVASAGGAVGDAAAGSETTSTLDEGSAAEVTTTTAPPAGSSLEGKWTASIQDLMSGGGAPSAGLTCDGSVTTQFRRGRNTVNGSGQCHGTGMDLDVIYSSSADHRVEGDQIIFSNYSDGSLMYMNETPIDGIVGTMGNGPVTYSITGNVLTTTIVDPDLGSLSQTYTRA